MYTINTNDLIFTSYYQPGVNYPWVVCDGEEDQRIEGIKDHVEAGDYFASLATVLDLTGQTVNKASVTGGKRLKKLKKDLLYLQKNYRIVEK
ncbi:MAG: hypothetical protein HQ530_05185 [Parcubacteria group bacterium]|nr:hypothetical protein [Parcubacteria group bacterium]